MSKGWVFAGPTSSASLRSPMKERRPSESREGGWMSFFQISTFFWLNIFTKCILFLCILSPCQSPTFTTKKKTPKLCIIISCNSFISLQWIWQDAVLERSPSYFQTRCTTVSSEVGASQSSCSCIGYHSLLSLRFETVPVENCWCIRDRFLLESSCHRVLLVFHNCTSQCVVLQADNSRVSVFHHYWLGAALDMRGEAVLLLAVQARLEVWCCHICSFHCCICSFYL